MHHLLTAMQPEQSSVGFVQQVCLGAQAITYADLNRRISKGETNVKRDLAALRSWMVHRQLMPHIAVGTELAEDFPVCRDAYLDACRIDLAGGAFRNRRSAINSVQGIYMSMRLSASLDVEAADMAMREAIRAALKKAGLTIAAAEKKYQACMAFWLKKPYHRPGKQGLVTLQRLEADAGLCPGALTRLVIRPGRRPARLIADFSGHKVKYRDWLRIINKDKYLIRFNDANFAHLYSQWLRFADYKTSRDPGVLERHRAWTKNKRGDFESKRKFGSFVRSFIGQLVLDKERGGAGLPQNAASFALLGSWELMRRYIEFRAQRSVLSDGYSNAFNEIFVNFCMLVHPRTGWLTQTEGEWFDDVAAAHSLLGIGTEDDIAAIGPGFFAEQFRLAKEWKRKQRPRVKKARDPRITLQLFLDVDQPMRQWIFPLIERMKADLPGRHTPQKLRQSAERELMMIVAFFAVPLRVINWQACEVGTNLVRDADGYFGLRITREEFKNREFLGDDYRIRIPAWAQSYFQHYVDNILPQFGPDSDGTQWLLPALDGSMLGVNGIHGFFRNVFVRYFRFGIGPHSARHIVTTDYIKQNPQNVIVAAVILNDTIETVTREYAHLLHQDHFRYFDDYVSKVAEGVFGKPRR